MTDFIADAIADRTLGLALHYPLLHAAVIGLNAQDTLEFGAGGSTRVILDALRETGGRHMSISTETGGEIAEKHGIPHGADWFHLDGLSAEHRDFKAGPLDLVLHDGSHTAEVVADDIAWVWPHVRQFGLLFVHDTQHSGCGADMRRGLQAGLLRAKAKFTTTTLSYGFGLTIVRREDDGEGMGPVSPAVAKVTSPHTTALAPFAMLEWRP